MDTYEAILDQISALATAPSGGERLISWLNDSTTLAVARDEAGNLELFLAGDALEPRTATVPEAMQFHDWHRDSGSLSSANRILLPAMGHFNQVGAFILTELLRNGANENLAGAFSQTEPIIELAIRRLHISESAMLGLVGELLVLSSLVQQADESQVAAVLGCWVGWHRSHRDFLWNGVGVEVKTTRRASSTHSVQGLHQIEPEPGDDSRPGEERLVLVSIGLTDAKAGSSAFSIPSLVDRILERLAKTGNDALATSFLQNVATYGSESGFGYNHDSMSNEAPFTNAYVTTFSRGYDMSDPNVQVLRHDVVAALQHVETDSVRFTISLPAVLTTQNPVNGANGVARFILGRPGGLPPR